MFLTPLPERDGNYLFHKHSGRVKNGGFQRKHYISGHSIIEGRLLDFFVVRSRIDFSSVLEKLFLNSELLCMNLVREGYEGFDSTGAHNKLQSPADQQHFMAATQGTTSSLYSFSALIISSARPVGENRWHRRYGMGKDWAPRLSPVSWWVFVSEDQHIQYFPERGEIHVTLDTVCK